MTRLNSTFRSGCKLDNRTTKGEKQAGQAHHLRSKSRVLSKQSRVFVQLEKSLIRTGKLFGTTLHERPRRTIKTTSEKAIRAMDVARQSSMEEGLQVQLLSWKEKPDNLISGKLKERCYDEDGVLSRVRDELHGSNGIHNDGQIKVSSQRNEATLGQIKGVEKIEACARSANRTQQNAKLVEKTLFDAAYLNQFQNSEASISNGISCDNMHLRSSRLEDLQGNIQDIQNESESLKDSCLTDANTDDINLNLMEVELKCASRPNNLPLCIDEDKCTSSIEGKRTAMKATCEEEGFATGLDKGCNENSKNMELEERADCRVDEVGLLDEKLLSSVDKVDISSKLKSQAELNDEPVIANECKDERQNCHCNGSSMPTSVKTVTSVEGRPKRATRRLRSIHEGDFILDVRQIPHKFNDKISTVKRGNKRTALPNCKKRKRTPKQDTCENPNLEEKTEHIEQVNATSKDNEEEKYVNVDCVLGVRHDNCNKQQVLVQFTDGTSNWIKKSEIKSPMALLCDYFSYPDQDLAASHRLPSTWFGCQLTSWEERTLTVSDFEDYEFYQMHDNKSKEAKHKDIYFSNKKRNKTPDDSLSVSHDISKHPLGLADDCQYFSDHDGHRTSPLHEELKGANHLFSGDCDHDCIPTNPVTLSISPNDDECSITDIDDVMFENAFNDNELIDAKTTDGSEKFLKRNSFVNDKTVLSDAVPIFVSRNGEIEVLQSDHIEIILKHKDKRSKRIRSETCDNLIHQLETRINDDKCKFVVINGMEDYFASSMDMEKLIKFPCEAEKTKYDEKMANLRYLFQTLKNYPKPIVAVISSAATGLAASLLSLVDVVYDQSTDEFKKNGMYSKPHLPVLAPKLMGLQHKNEALLMGEFPDTQLDEQLRQVNNIFKSFRFSNGITSTLKEMRLNEKLSSERPDPKKKGRQHLAKASPKSPYESHQTSYNKTRLARLRCPLAFDKTEVEDSDVDKALKNEIEKEQELAAQCLKELNEFWNEIAESACKL